MPHRFSAYAAARCLLQWYVTVVSHCVPFAMSLLSNCALILCAQATSEIRKYSVHELVTNAMSCIKLCTVSNTVDYCVKIENGIDEMWTDGHAITRNLLNLLANANRHTREGSITASAKLCRSQSRNNLETSCTSQSRSTSQWIEFSVTDTGCGGVSMEPAIWSPFVSMAKSTGLGLWVVKKQAESMGGAVGADENHEHGGGSIFWFRVPYVTKKHVLDAQPSGDQSGRGNPTHSIDVEPIVTGNGKQQGDILIIDDVHVVLELQAQELRMRGFTVETAVGAAEGMKLMTRFTWGLVLCDYNMPGQTGAELIADLRKWEVATHRPTKQLIYGLTSNMGDPNVKTMCIDAGMQEVWGKPLDVELICQTLGVNG